MLGTYSLTLQELMHTLKSVSALFLLNSSCSSVINCVLKHFPKPSSYPCPFLNEKLSRYPFSILLEQHHWHQFHTVSHNTHWYDAFNENFKALNKY